MQNPILVGAALIALASPALAEDTAAWRTSLGKDAGARALVVTADTVVAATWDSRVVGLDAATGKQRWQRKHPEHAGADILLAAAGGQVVMGISGQPDLAGVAPADGKPAWRRTASGPVQSLSACPGHRVVGATWRGVGPQGVSTLLLHALDPLSGATLWQTPTPGDLVGAGPGWFVVATPSGTGRLMASLSVVSCADGSLKPLPAPNRRFSSFLAADATTVISSHFEFGFRKQVVCVSDIATRTQECFEPTDGEVPAHHVSGAVLTEGLLHLSTNHMGAHNLDPSPDGWIFRWDRATKRFTGRSEALTSIGLLADAGQQLVSGFGTTGIEDFAYLVDPATGARLAQVPLKKAPRAVAADAERGYVGTYDGEIVALKLVRPGKKPLAEVAVAQQAIPEPAKAPDLGWSKVRTFAAHPKVGRTSGSKGPGSVDDLEFLDGTRLVVGGNDDRVAVYDVTTGKRLWRSPKLGKDVQRVATCEGAIAGQIYGGDVFVFAQRGRGFRRAQRLRPGHGWAFGMAKDCTVLVDDFGGNFTLYDGKGGKQRASFEAKGIFDRRGVRVVGSRAVISRPGVLEAIDLSDLREGPSAAASWPTQPHAHGGQLRQARLMPDGRLLREYCSPTSCTLEIVGEAEVHKTITLDVTGNGWSPSVPSEIAVAPDGKTLVFFRRQLDLLLVDVETGARQPLHTLAGPQSGLVEAAFSPDGRYLAIARHPKPWEVTLLERSK